MIEMIQPTPVRELILVVTRATNQYSSDKTNIGAGVRLVQRMESVASRSGGGQTHLAGRSDGTRVGDINMLWMLHLPFQMQRTHNVSRLALSICVHQFDELKVSSTCAECTRFRNLYVRQHRRLPPLHRLHRAVYGIIRKRNADADERHMESLVTVTHTNTIALVFRTHQYTN